MQSPLFPWHANGETFVAEKKMFLKKIGNIFCFLETKNVSQQMFRSRANRETFRETCFLNKVSATMFPRLRGP